MTTTFSSQPSSPGIDSAYAWMRLGISMLLATIGGVGMWAVVVVLPAVQAEFGVDRAAASMPYTATMVGFAVGNVVVGRAIDRVGYWIPALIASVALGTGFLLASLTTSILQFTLAQGLLIGVGTSAIFGPLIADISHWFNRRRGVAVTAAAAGSYLAGAVWPMAMPYVMQSEGWRFTYGAIGVVCVATMVPLIPLLRRGAPRAAAPGSPGSRPVQPISLSPAALQMLLVVAGLGCCVAMSMPQVHIVAYCMDLGYGMARGADMLSIMMVAGVVSRLASGFLADRIGGVKTLLIGSVLQGLSLLFYIPFDGLASLYVCLAGFRPVARRHRALLCHHRARIHAGQRGRPARRRRNHGDDLRHGDRRLDVGLDLRYDRLLRRRIPQRRCLEPAEHSGHGAAAVEGAAQRRGDGLSTDPLNFGSRPQRKFAD